MAKARPSTRSTTARTVRALLLSVAATMTFCVDLASAAAMRQDEPPADQPVQVEPSNDPLPPAATPSEPQAQRLQLIREGSYLVDAKGRLESEADGLLWTFVPIAADDRSTTQTELILLPCTLLAEMQRLARSLPDREVVFELTGQVTVYKGRNFLLPTSAPRLAGFEASSDAADDRESAGDPVEAEGGGMGAQSADEAEQQLQRALSGRGQASSSRAVVPGAGETGADSIIIEADGSEFESLDEGTILAARRGTIARDSGGAWVFVFDADAEGAADPPLVLLPCLQLERIEEYARLMGAHAPVLLSGRIHRYEGRGYLLPSAFRIPAEHSLIAP